MSLFGALSSSVSGIQAQGTAIGIISDNISNVNTVGYKAGSQYFSTLVTASGSTVSYSPGGVRAQNRQLIDQQGLIQTSNSPLDVAISGDGFFVVSSATGGLSTGADVSYTRAGSFRTDSLGNFVNASGQYLQAWPIDPEGRLPGEPGNLNTTLSTLLDSLETVNIGSASGDASATTRVELGVNLNASQTKFRGAGDTGTPIATSINADIAADDVIVPTSNLQQEDGLTVVTSDTGTSYSFTYDGFQTSTSASAGTPLFGASTATQTFSSTLAGLVFTIETADTNGAATFTYKSSNPNTLIGEFNSLSTLASAIDNVTGLSSRVVTSGSASTLYLAPEDANLALDFEAVSDPTGTFLTDINFIDTTSGSNRFATMQGLANIINGSAIAGVSASISSAQADSSIDIFADSPLATITFANIDGAALTGAAFLTEFGMTASTALGPSYQASTSSLSMASGNITPHFERGIRVFDAFGEGHDLRVGFLKLDERTWAAEIFAINGDEVPALPDGQIAAGTIVFNNDGSLRSVTQSLLEPDAIVWSNEAAPSSLVFDFGTQGEPVGTTGAANFGLTDGLRQFSAPYNVDFINQNGAAAGLLDSVTIDEDGFITANFNNGETKILYKIPLADFANPNGLISKTGNVFSQSFGSGEVNLKQIGEGGVGRLSPSSLETANSDLSEELTDMIVAQRAYQAAAKVITTADELLEELNRVT